MMRVMELRYSNEIYFDHFFKNIFKLGHQKSEKLFCTA